MRARIVCIAAVFLVFASVAAPLILPFFHSQRSIWPEHYTATARAEVVESLGRDGLPFDIVSPATSYVYVSTFDSVETISVDSLDQRLVSEDPRFDRYMRTVRRYFDAGADNTDVQTVYIGHRLPPVLTSIVLWIRRGISPAEIRYADFSLLRIGARFLFLVGFVVFFRVYAKPGAISRYEKRGIGAAVVPLIPVAVQGGAWGLFAAILVFAVWYRLIVFWLPIFREYLSYGAGDSSKRIRAGSARFVISVLAAVAASSLHPKTGVAIAGLGCSLLGIVGVFLLLRARVKRNSRLRDHRLFIPVPLYPKRTRDRYPIVTMCIGLLLCGGLYFVESMGRAPFPQPHRAIGVEGYTWEDLERLYVSSEFAVLPDVADFVAHAAYQRGIVADYEYRFPEQGEKVAVSSYSRKNDRIVRGESILFTFDDSWLEEVLAVARQSGIPRLLMTDSMPLSAVRENPTAVSIIVRFVLVFTSSSAILYLSYMRGFGDLTAGIFYVMRKCSKGANTGSHE